MVFQGNYEYFDIDRIEKFHDWVRAVGVNDRSGYGRATYEYASAWAALMEKRMAEGNELKDIAEQCSRDADTKGITGFMYGCAVGVLSIVWTHGEELRIWNNAKWGDVEDQDDDGGVINPAILTITAKAKGE